jgi:hypothetical protein
MREVYGFWSENPNKNRRTAESMRKCPSRLGAKPGNERKRGAVAVVEMTDSNSPFP